MTLDDAMPQPDGPEDERFVYVVTAAGVEALRRSVAALDSEPELPAAESHRRAGPCDGNRRGKDQEPTTGATSCHAGP